MSELFEPLQSTAPTAVPSIDAVCVMFPLIFGMVILVADTLVATKSVTLTFVALMVADATDDAVRFPSLPTSKLDVLEPDGMMLIPPVF